MYNFAFILDLRVKLQGPSKCLAHIGASLEMDFTTQYTNIHNKLFEVYAMYEKKFDNLGNQMQNTDQRKGLLRKLFKFKFNTNNNVAIL